MTETQQPATTNGMAREERGPAYPLYERVLAELNRREWTQTRLEEESGVARTTWDKWKYQPRSPRASTIRAVAQVLGIDHAEALRLAGIPESRIPRDRAAPTAPSDPSAEHAIEELQAQLDATLEQMTPEDRERWKAEMRREEVERLERWRRLMSGEQPIPD